MGKGRPKKRYRLSRPGGEHNLQNLSSAILNLLRSRLSTEEYQAFINSLAGALASSISPAHAASSLSHKMTSSIQFLNACYYAARWEAHKTGPRVTFHNCPYAAIIDDHPELCTLDQKILEYLLGLPVEQTIKLEATPQGLFYCCFQVKA
jgi:predicted ArsR family transcriptional regulator